jgi:protein arginine kinase activator
MMLCQNCGKHEATTHVTQVINGKKTELYLCPQCAGQMGNPFSSMFSDLFFPNTAGSHSMAETTCPSCGMTLSRLEETGRVGCGQCYSVFSQALLPYIRRVQGTDHQKKPQLPVESKTSVPVKPVAKKPQTKLEKLQAELQEAIAKENYEQAAVLRDQIKECRKEDQA